MPALEPPIHPATSRVVHFVTGDPLAFTHTANVIGGVEGEIIPLAVTELNTLHVAQG
jgi:hypothetical protein